MRSFAPLAFVAVFAFPRLASAQGGTPAKPEYSASELQRAKDKAIEQAPLSAAEKNRLRSGVTLKNAHLGQGSNAHTLVSQNTIVINVAQTSVFAPPGSEQAVECLAQVILHEIFHLEPPSPGGSGGGVGPSNGGVPGGTDCRHIGLQYWASLQLCSKAQAALAAGNVPLATALCRQLHGASGPLRRITSPPWVGKYFEAARVCRDQGHSTVPGPGTWGFPFPPFAQSVCEPCQQNHLGGF